MVKIIWANFNARTMSGYINLGTRTAARSIKEKGGVDVDEVVILMNGEISVIAKVVKIGGGTLFADPDWSTMKIISGK